MVRTNKCQRNNPVRHENDVNACRQKITHYTNTSENTQDTREHDTETDNEPVSVTQDTEMSVTTLKTGQTTDAGMETHYCSDKKAINDTQENLKSCNPNKSEHFLKVQNEILNNKTDKTGP